MRDWSLKAVSVKTASSHNYNPNTENVKADLQQVIRELTVGHLEIRVVYSVKFAKLESTKSPSEVYARHKWGAFQFLPLVGEG